jgi:undecaprenyl-diphosphatase
MESNFWLRDSEILRWFNERAGQSETADFFLKYGATLGFPLVAVIGIGVLLLLPEPKSARRWSLVAALFVSIGAVIAAVAGVNFLAWKLLSTPVLRPRPYIASSVNLLLTEQGDNSFPSGETALCFACAMTVFLMSRKAGAGLLLASAVVGAARVCCGVNYPTDVVAGGVLGVCVSLICGALFGQTLRAWARWKQVAIGVTPLCLAAAACVAYIACASSYATPALAYKAYNVNGQSPTNPIRPSPMRERLFGEHLKVAEARLLKSLRLSGNQQRVVHVGVARNEFSRVAEVWFDARWNGVLKRSAVERTATKIIRTAFHTEPRLREIDVVGIVPLKVEPRFVVFSVNAQRAKMPSHFTPATDAEFLRCFGLVYYDERRLPQRGVWQVPASEALAKP